MLKSKADLNNFYSIFLQFKLDTFGIRARKKNIQMDLGQYLEAVMSGCNDNIT